METSKLVEQHIPCPCGKSSDAYCTYDDGHGFCFSCSRRFEEEKEVNTSTSIDYVPWRGISRETMEFFGVITNLNSEGEPLQIAFPYDTGWKVRDIKEKKFSSNGDMKGPKLFGMDRFSAGSSKAITLFEGELDALSGYQILNYPCVSVKSASSAFTDCSYLPNLEYLKSFELVYICFDNDEPGIKARDKVTSLLGNKHVRHVKLTKYKDCNEYLQNNEEKTFRNIWYNSKEPGHVEGIVSSLSEFDELIDKAINKPSVAYPFPTLQEMTYGIRTGESVLITALEGVGKTEILRAIEYHLLKTTDSNLAIIHLEESKDTCLKRLASYELGVPSHIKKYGIDDDTIKSTIHKVIGRDDRVFLYSGFGSSSPDEILATIRYLVVSCGCKYVFLDHISHLVSGSLDDKDTKVLDYLSTHLERMVEELDFALIFISHVNDDGKTRGSRYIGKSAAVRIDLNRNITAETEAERNRTYLTVSKNRFGSITGPAGVLTFDPNTFKVEETKESVTESRADRLPT